MDNHLKDGKLLRIFIGENDRIGQVPMYEKIVFDAKKLGISGATVLRGIMGFGANSRIHTAKLLEISSDLPLIVELVDTEDKIRAFTTHVEQLFEQARCGGLITIEKAEVIRYQPAK